MGRAFNLASLLNGSGLVNLPTKVTGALPDANAPSGSVIQVVSVNLGTYLEIASTTLTSTGLSASITPTSSSSKILIISNICTALIIASGDSLTGIHQIRRDSTQILLSQRATWVGGAVGSSGSSILGTTIPLNVLDSPATTSSVTYSIYAAASSTANTGVVRINDYNNTVGTAPSTITLLEIAA